MMPNDHTGFDPESSLRGFSCAVTPLVVDAT